MTTLLLCQNLVYAYLFFFFFQAEDGIRDRTVTGVQTCALPIYPPPPAGPSLHVVHLAQLGAHQPLDQLHVRVVAGLEPNGQIGRASCREKCRSWWSPEY